MVFVRSPRRRRSVRAALIAIVAIAVGLLTVSPAGIGPRVVFSTMGVEPGAFNPNKVIWIGRITTKRSQTWHAPVAPRAESFHASALMRVAVYGWRGCSCGVALERTNTRTEGSIANDSGQAQRRG